LVLPSMIKADYTASVREALLGKGVSANQQDVLAFYSTTAFDLMKADWLFCGIILLVTGIIIWLAIRKTISAQVAIYLILVVTVVDLWRVGKRHYELSAEKIEDVTFAKTDIVDFLQKEQRPYRIVDVTNSPANGWAYHFIESVHGYSSAKIRAYQDMLDIAGPGANREAVPGNSVINNPFLWNLLNVRYIITTTPPPPGAAPAAFVSYTGKYVYNNDQALPRAWFVDSVVVEQNDKIVLVAMRDGTFNPRNKAYVRERLSVQPADSNATALVKARGNQHLSIATENTAKSFLVVSEVFYKEWQCTIDGQPVPIYQTNHVLRGVVVPPGKHMVTFTFKSTAFEQGKTISIASNIAVGVVLLLAIVGQWKRKAE
jgi:uncharacterized membrane protein YfhO